MDISASGKLTLNLKAWTWLFQCRTPMKQSERGRQSFLERPRLVIFAAATFVREVSRVDHRRIFVKNRRNSSLRLRLADMKFQCGDATDQALCVALKHEFLRCDDAFADFVSLAEIMITQGENRRVAYKTYNAYARFIHHLYEFTMGAITRERHDTTPLSSDMADRYLASEVQRILTNRREAIIEGTAPEWENALSALPERIPSTFAEEFRRVRNAVSGHVKFQRSNIDLSDFYHRNHKFLHMLYRDIRDWWGRTGEEFPELNQITAFSVCIKEEPPRRP